MKSLNDVCENGVYTLITKCKELLIPLVNECFGTSYQMTQEIDLKIVPYEEEFAAGVPVVFLIGSDRYEIRFMELDENTSAISMHGPDSNRMIQKDGLLHCCFPDIRIFFLQEGSYRDKEVKLHFDLPEGTVTHSVMKQSITNYNDKDLFNKGLYFLIPFYFCKLAEELSMRCSDYIVLLDSVFGTISRKLKSISENEITSHEKQRVLNLSTQIISQLAIRAGVFEGFFMLVSDGFYTAKEAAEKLKVTQEEFECRFKVWKK